MKQSDSDLSVILWAVLALAVLLLVVQRVESQVHPRLECEPRSEHISCKAQSVAGHDVTWRVYLLVHGDEELQVYENDASYNLYVEIYVPRSTAVVEMEVDGQVLRIYALQTEEGVAVWDYE